MTEKFIQHLFIHLFPAMHPLVSALDVIYLNTFTKLPALTRIYSKYRNKPNRHNAFIQYAEVYFCETAFFPLQLCSFS